MLTDAQWARSAPLLPGHTVADARGRFVRGSVTAGQRHDAPQALPLLEGLSLA